MILAAYFDVSTSKRESFVTPSDDWTSVARLKTFDSKWHKMLRKKAYHYFHITDFEAYQGHYKDWSKTRHNHLFKKIARTNRKRKFAFGRGVAHDHFADHLEIKCRALVHSHSALHNVSTLSRSGLRETRTTTRLFKF